MLVAGCAMPGVDNAANMSGPITLQKQGSFFVGGDEIHSDGLSANPVLPASGTITVNQMYVHYQVPVSARSVSLVLVHGCCLTGKTWETTPDGRMGWDEYFVRSGFPTYVIDQVSRGRSATDPTAMNAVKSGRSAAETLPVTSSASHEAAWAIFRFGPQYPQLYPGLTFPMDALPEFWKQMVPDSNLLTPAPTPTARALATLAKQVKNVVLVSHSQSGPFPFQSAAIDRSGIAGIIAIEPAGCPAPTVDMTPFRGMPILIVWGDNVRTSPHWRARLPGCQAFVDAANAAGAKAEVLELANIGLPGASHMLMQDTTSLKTAAWLTGWLDQKLGR